MILTIQIATSQSNWKSSRQTPTNTSPDLGAPHHLGQNVFHGAASKKPWEYREASAKTKPAHELV
jgi:hypothetical protein